MSPWAHAGESQREGSPALTAEMGPSLLPLPSDPHTKPATKLLPGVLSELASEMSSTGTFLPAAETPTRPTDNTHRRGMGQSRTPHLPWYTLKYIFSPFILENIKKNFIIFILGNNCCFEMHEEKKKLSSIKIYLTEQSQTCTWHCAYHLISSDGAVKCINVNSIHKKSLHSLA